MFEATTRAIFAKFSEPVWTDLGIPAVPADVTISSNSSSFVKVTVVAPSTGVNFVSNDGMLFAEIYTKKGEGPLLSSVIADKLSLLFGNKVLEIEPGAVVQIFQPMFRNIGVDSDNKTLLHTQLSFKFKSMKVV